jgi:hypothetical protein
MLKGRHASLGQRLSSLESTVESLDELTEAQGQEQGPEKRERAHDVQEVVIVDRHAQGVTALGIRLPEQQLVGEMVYGTAVSTKVDCQLLAGIAITI